MTNRSWFVGSLCRASLAVNAFALVLSFGGSAVGQPVRVELVREGEGWQLQRGGERCMIRGAGGGASKDRLARLGANSFRTWGIDAGTAAQLDEAERLALNVCLGIWLGHERHGFDYSDLGQVARQKEEARTAIERFKDHPALLMWGIGNEMEGTGDNPAIFEAVQEIAALAHELDPNHPTMTVIAEVGGEKVRNLHRFCLDVDVVGINTYAGARSVPRRYREAGGTKPYVITEFGPPGPWERRPGQLGVIEEPTSTEKADWYRKACEAFAADSALCLGSYAFIWGTKQEATATWFGMLLPGGQRTAAVDVLAEFWTGRPPGDLCPAIEGLKLDREDGLDPGAKVHATLDVRDPEGAPLQVTWILARDSGRVNTGGDPDAPPPEFADAIVRSDATSADVVVPKSGGVYRLFAFVADGKGGGATANVSFRVTGAAVTLPPLPGRKAGLPLEILADGATPAFTPSGWMGNTGAIQMDLVCRDDPRAGESCGKFTYAAPDRWGGIVWQDPPNDWGERPGGYWLVGASRLTFWVRGATGGETVEFGFGLLGRDKRHYDTASAKRRFALTKEWTQHAFDLRGKDLSRIKTGFYWTAAGQGKAVTFYLDDVRFE